MKIDSPTFVSETRFISASVAYSSGSQKFGNTLDDIHQFTGSLSVSASKLNVRRSALSGFDAHDDDLLVVERSGDYSNVNLASDVGSYLLFSDAARARGEIGYVHSSDTLTFGVGGVQNRMILDTNSRVFPSTRGLGTSNTAFGKFALNEDEAGSNYNTAFGESAIGSATLNDATYNTAVGFTALESLTTGDYNVSV